MKAVDRASDASPSREEEIRAEQIRSFLKDSTKGMFFAIPLGLITAYLLMDDNSPSSLAVWLVCIYGLLGLRIMLGRKWAEQLTDHRCCGQISHSLLLIWALSGTVWGTGLFLFMPVDNLTLQLTILVLTALVMMASVSAASAYAPAFLVFLYPIMGLQALWFAWQADKLHLIIAAVVVFFTLLLTLAAMAMQENVVKYIRLRIEKIDLLHYFRSYKNAMEHASDAIAIFSRNGFLEYANKSMCYLSGWSLQDMKGKHWNEIYTDIDQALAFYRAGLSMTGQPWQGTLHLRGKEDRDVVLMSSFSPVLDRETGGLSQCIIIQRDMGEEEKIRKREQRLQRVESLAVMAGGIAHDFNNLLTTIMGNASLLSMSPNADDETQQFCQRINESCDKAADLCDQMLAYSGQGKYTIKPVNMADLLRSMRSGLNASIHAKVDGRGKFACQIDDDMPYIEADESQIRQIITHLVDNASDAIVSKKRDARVTVKLYSVRLTHDELKEFHTADHCKAGAYVCLEVRDNGEGMSRHTQEHVFDPFFSTRLTGRGLGLPAVMGMVFGHAGAIHIDSQAGQGTVVQAFFPCLEQQLDAAQSLEEMQTSSIISWSGMGTVLVVDDDAPLLAVASNMIERCGFQVLAVGSGAEAIELYRQHQDKILLVLLDWSMPEIDGEEVARALVNIDPQVNILLSSGYSEAMVMESFSGIGIAAYVQKPYSFEQLKFKLRDVIRTSSVT